MRGGQGTRTGLQNRLAARFESEAPRHLRRRSTAGSAPVSYTGGRRFESSRRLQKINADVAQLVERRLAKAKVAGSIPAVRSKYGDVGERLKPAVCKTAALVATLVRIQPSPPDREVAVL